MINVAVLGATGRMGSTTCSAVEDASDMELVARVGPDDTLDSLSDLGVHVAVDFTTPDSVMDNLRALTHQGIAAVVGTTGLDADRLVTLSSWSDEANSPVFVAPNFALGAVLMMTFARAAAPYFDSAEIVERHHDKKIDAPSGTSLRTAEMMEGVRDEPFSDVPGAEERGQVHSGVRIHSVRLPGSVAHQEVLFGGTGETLSIRHDSLDRSSFMPGVLMAIRKVRSTNGLTVGLENLLEL